MDRNAKILRELLRKEGNRKCMDCKRRGPQYAVINFSTFVCSTCSGIHREFSHRVKGISMSSFTRDEMAALKKGGNDVARKKWLARWNPSDFPEPEADKVTAIRQFIRYKYIERRWYDDSKLTKPTPAPQKTVAPPKKISPAKEDIRHISELVGRKLPKLQVGDTRAPPQGDTSLAKPTTGTAKQEPEVDIYYDGVQRKEQDPFGLGDLEWKGDTSQPVEQAQPSPDKGGWATFGGGQQPPVTKEPAPSGPSKWAQAKAAITAAQAASAFKQAATVPGWMQQQPAPFVQQQQPTPFVQQQPAPFAQQQGYGGNPFGGAPQQPFVQQQPFGGAPQQPFGGAPQQPFGGAPQQPFGGAPQQPFGGAPQQPFSGAPQPQYGQPSSFSPASQQPPQQKPDLFAALAPQQIGKSDGNPFGGSAQQQPSQPGPMPGFNPFG